MTLRLPTQLDWDEFYVLFVLRRLPPRGTKTLVESTAQFLVDDLVELARVYPGWRYNVPEAHVTCAGWIFEIMDAGYIVAHEAPVPELVQGKPSKYVRPIELSEKGETFLREIPKNDPDIYALYEAIPWSSKRLLDALAQEG